MLATVPVQNAPRLAETDGVTVFSGVEARVIMLGFSQDKDTLYFTDGNVDGNPFTDARVRQAVAHAVDVPAIVQVIMGGLAKPAAQLQPAGLSGYSAVHTERPVYDPDAARALLAEAGYPDGFTFSFRCPNDRYLNDADVCLAITGMLRQVGLNAAHTPTEQLGTWNFGGYSNARIDELLPQIQQELDPAARQAMLDEVAGIIQDETAYVPLYEEPLVWAARDGVELVQRPDNFLMLRWVTVN
jgi:peptide/nickel transport system substrate-binding protein